MAASDHDEIGWVIESPHLAATLGHAAMYWAGGVAWSHDNQDAIRFARETDGKRVLERMGTGVHDAVVREHMWVGA